ncbi:hypothetical protein SS05631_c33580 [Sinorhizobium sp. CCBAU 05631]|nr:hypothetical protein SS05631_c33580 [Sinorhizobium sp. CCBAU 05631]
MASKYIGNYGDGFDPFLYGLSMKKEDWRRERQEWLKALARGDDPAF